MPSPETVKELPSSQRILQMLTGKWIAQAVSVAATLGIADLLVGGPQSVEQLAAATTTHPDSLHRLLRALASLGIFAETEDGRFTLTDLAQCLRSEAPRLYAELGTFAWLTALLAIVGRTAPLSQNRRDWAQKGVRND